jgi:flagellar biosynthesis/type III secretory pathway protein FliH
VSYITSAERIGIKKGYEQGIQHGMQQGIQQGVQQGMQQGEYSLLLRLLEHKFKSVPESYRQRLIGADAETLLIWGERVLDANTLNEIFED